MTDAELRVQCGVVIHGWGRRKRWLQSDTKSVKALMAIRPPLTIRRMADVARCSERTIQDVKKGLYD